MNENSLLNSESTIWQIQCLLTKYIIYIYIYIYIYIIIICT